MLHFYKISHLKVISKRSSNFGEFSQIMVSWSDMTVVNTENVFLPSLNRIVLVIYTSISVTLISFIVPLFNPSCLERKREKPEKNTANSDIYRLLKRLLILFHNACVLCWKVSYQGRRVTVNSNNFIEARVNFNFTR